VITERLNAISTVCPIRKILRRATVFFAELVEEIHARGMKVILDGVFNHCGSFNKWLDREEIYQVSGDYEDGAFVSKDSPYRTFVSSRPHCMAGIPIFLQHA